MSMDVMRFDVNDLILNQDGEQDDGQLHKELKQLIADELDNFDLGDEYDNIIESESLHPEDGNSSLQPLTTQGTLSILAAGKLSLLECAIQRFGQEDTQVSDDVPSTQLSPGSFQGLISVDESKSTHSYGDVQAAVSGGLNLVCTDVNDINESNNNPLPHYGGVSELVSDRNASEEGVQQGFVVSQPPPVTLLGAVYSNRDNTNGRDVMQYPEVVSNRPWIMTRQDSLSSQSSARNTSGALGSYFEPLTPTPGPNTQIGALASPPAYIPNNTEERRELLYVARGKRIQELITEVDTLKETAAKEKRIAVHRATLTESELESVQSKLFSSEALIASLQQDLLVERGKLQSLQQNLSDSEQSNKTLTNQLTNLRSTNESLSAQLVELTMGDAVRRAEQLEDKLTETLERRHNHVVDELRSELERINKQLNEKKSELSETQKQLELSRSHARQAQETHDEAMNRSMQQLAEAQQHCQKLASSALCSEVNALRQKVSDLEMSKKIAADVNTILQDELRDLREQIIIYERILRLDRLSGGDHLSTHHISTNAIPRDSNSDKPLSARSVSFATHAFKTTPPTRPGSACKEARTYELTGNVPAIRDDFEQLDEFNRISEPISTTRLASSDPCLDQLLLSPTRELPEFTLETDPFRSLAHRDIPTSTPGPNVCMSRLRSELERCLMNYRAKREQITKLHETIFTTRCQLHHATERADRSEKSVESLQERIQALERELSTLEKINGSPGPRESALCGQLDRLKVDYQKLEEELQCVRTRLQTALGSEARALENEKAASERLAASAAEREAAVERARAVCEAHYSTLRRKLETEWSTERDRIARDAEEKWNDLRKEYQQCELELHRITALHQEAESVAQKSIDGAILEAMQEREAERIRFWREELPLQLEAARSVWEQEWGEKRDIAVREAVEASLRDFELKQSRVQQPVRQCVVSAQTSFLGSIMKSVGTLTDAPSIRSVLTQTDMDLIISQCITNSTSKQLTLIPSQPESQFQLLRAVLGREQFCALHVQLIESSRMTLKRLADSFDAYIKQRSFIEAESVWQSVHSDLDHLIEQYQLMDFVNHHVSASATNASTPSASGLAVLRNSSLDGTSLHSLKMDDDDCQPFSLQMRDQSIGHENLPIQARVRVLLRLRILLQIVVSLRASTEGSGSDINHHSLLHSKTDVRNVDVNGSLPSEIYFKTLEKIKAEVLAYVQACQSRAAQTLHNELSRVHRKACHQFNARLRRALHETAGVPFAENKSPSITGTRLVFPKRVAVQQDSSLQPSPIPLASTDCCEQGMLMSLPSTTVSSFPPPSQTKENSNKPFCSRLTTDWESLLHVIDEVCASTEANFKADLIAQSPLFDLMGEIDLNSIGSNENTKDKTQASITSQSLPQYPRVGSRKNKMTSRSPKPIPSRTRSDLAWLKFNPNTPKDMDTCNRQKPTTNSTEAASRSTIPLNAPNPRIFSDESNRSVQLPSTPTPIPRLPRSGRSSESISNAPPTSNVVVQPSMCIRSPSDVTKKIVHTDLFNLFERFTSPDSEQQQH